MGNKKTKKEYIEQYNAAIEKLGSGNSDIRIASFHQLHCIAEGCPDDLKKDIFDHLCTYLRNMSRERSHATIQRECPTKECGILLDVLFRSADRPIFRKFEADLHGAYLIGTRLVDGYFKNANLSEADFSNANFLRAKLIGANLLHTNLSGARLWSADLSETDLSGANLSGTNLSEANLWEAQLKGANLHDVLSIEQADFHGAKIGDKPITEDAIPAGKGEYYADWK